MTFIPQRYLVNAITNANPAVVTTSSTNTLTTGQVVRINIPPSYGMQEISHKLFSITVLNNTTFSLQYRQVPEYVNVDTTNFTAFVNVGTGTPAEVLSVGSAPTPVLSPDPANLRNIAVTVTDDAIINNSTVPIPF